MKKKNPQQTISATGAGVSYTTLTPRSHLILKAYKFRIYPNMAQRILLAKHFGCCRFAYNHFLSERNKAFKDENRKIGLFETHHMIAMMRQTEEYGWLKEVYGHSLQYSLRCLEVAFKNYFKKVTEEPKYHSKHGTQSCTFPDNATVVDGNLKLPKFKALVKMSMHRPIEGKIHTVTISKNTRGKYYASILAECEQEMYEPCDRRIGIDLGIKDLAVCSNGERIANPKFLEKAEKHLKYLHKELSKKKKRSHNRRRARQRLSRFYEAIANRRRDYTHKFTTRIVRENQTVCVEDLNVKGMESNHHLAKSVVSASFGEIVRQLEYKCKWYGREFVKVGRWFPSSKTCNHCGHKYSELTLKDREWVCPACGSTIDRDYNAALNIRDEGMRILSGGGSPSDAKQKGVEALQLCESMRH